MINKSKKIPFKKFKFYKNYKYNYKPKKNLGKKVNSFILKNIFFLRQLISINGHLGYKVQSWQTQMRMNIFAIRYGYHVLNLINSLFVLKHVFFHIKSLIFLGKNILFCSENKFIDSYLKKIILSSKQYISSYSWLGGTVTNFRRVLLALIVVRLKKRNTIYLKKLFSSIFKADTKDEVSSVLLKRTKYFVPDEHYLRTESILNGMAGLTKLPSFLIILNGAKSKWAVNEAFKAKIPSVSFIDTVSSLKYTATSYIIPINSSSFGVQVMLCGIFKFYIDLALLKNKFLFKKTKRSIKLNKYKKWKKNKFK